LSEALKGKPSPMKGKHQSEEWKRKIGLSNLGKRRTEEEKLKMGEAVKKAYSNPELRERMSEAHKGKKASEETKLKLKEHRAKQVFPIKDSKPELKIQGFLNELGIVFLKHKNMAIKHSYQCDIFIPLMNLIIEIDGDYWHGNQNNPRHKILNKHQIEQREEDNIRTKELQEKGFRVLRLWESDIKKMSLKDFSKALNLY
jgi:G:T-mismatch repair DNA endonuclease (very short patch repair protein)